MGKFKLLLALLAVLMFSGQLIAEEAETTKDDDAAVAVKAETTVPAKPVVKKAAPKKPNLIRATGGVEILSETTLGERTITDFYQRASLFIFGNVKPKKLGYFIHLMSFKDPINSKNDKSFKTAVAFVWMNPTKFLNIRFGELKKPAETTYLPLWSDWMFPRPPMGFGLVAKEGMASVDTGIQVIAKYKKLLALQLNAFRTGASVSPNPNPYFNLLYFAGLKVTPTFGKAKVGLFANYGAEPHAGLFTTDSNNVVTAVKRNTLTAGAWAKAYNVEFYSQYIDYKREKTNLSNSTTTTPESTDLMVQLAYNLKVKDIIVHPRVRYDMLDKSTSTTGDGNTAIIVGVDAILATNPGIRLNYKIGIEYQMNQEESNEKKNDIVRLTFEVGHF